MTSRLVDDTYHDPRYNRLLALRGLLDELSNLIQQGHANQALTVITDTKRLVEYTLVAYTKNSSA